MGRHNLLFNDDTRSSACTSKLQEHMWSVVFQAFSWVVL